jgi:ectoine hydroxylase-related dioxygenase (phytanoyl-CoA dioxygenase family)
LKQRGYLGLTVADRTGDIERLAAGWSIPLAVHAPELEAGDAVLFHTNCFHQAVTPSQGFRDVMTFFVLPSRRPWRESVGDLLRLEKRPGGFPPQPEMIPAWV